jgi:hypothetical protein
VRYADIKDELDLGLDVVHVPVRSDMKEVDPNAAKGMLEYDPFIGRDAVKAVKAHLATWRRDREAALLDGRSCSDSA